MKERRADARRLLIVCALLALGGCATVDPLEPINRKMFAFNDAVDTHLLKPTAQLYRKTLPSPVRAGVRNFFGNVKDAWSAVNLMLQGRVGESFNDGMRFSVNTVFGLVGVMDVASEMGMESHGQDFGLTLGRWGVKPGPYIVWPILGPSTLRDSVGLPLDMMATPEHFITPVAASNAVTVVHLVDTRANLLTLTDVLDDVALDPYTFLRDGYLQRRANLINDGDEPPDSDPGNKPQGQADVPVHTADPAPSSAVKLGRPYCLLHVGSVRPFEARLTDPSPDFDPAP